MVDTVFLEEMGMMECWEFKGQQGLQCGPAGGPQGSPGIPGARGINWTTRAPRTLWTEKWRNDLPCQVGKELLPNDCTGAQLVYAGRVGGTHASHSGGGPNYLCMPLDPQYLHLWGIVTVTCMDLNTIGGARNDDTTRALCQLCMFPHMRQLMLPANTSGPISWTREY